MPLIETASLVQFAWESLKKAAAHTVEEGANKVGSSLLSKAVKRITPSHQERVAKSLFTTFGTLLAEEFENYFVLSAEGEQIAKDTQIFLSNPSVQSWLAEPLDPVVTSLNYAARGRVARVGPDADPRWLSRAERP